MSHVLNLSLHAGGHPVQVDELARVETPESTASWTPIPHINLLNGIRESIEASELSIINESHGIARDGARYFGMLQVQNGHEDDGYGFVVGIRNSHDKSFPAGLALGSGVFVCDNLAFSGEIRLARKHTVFINRDLPKLITTAVARLGDFRQKQAVRYDRYRNTEIVAAQANDLIIRAVEAQALPVTKIPEVLTEWKTPRHPEFVEAGRTAWRLFNAFSEALKGGDANTLMKRTIVLHGLFDSECHVLKDVEAKVTAV